LKSAKLKNKETGLAGLNLTDMQGANDVGFLGNFFGPFGLFGFLLGVNYESIWATANKICDRFDF